MPASMLFENLAESLTLFPQAAQTGLAQDFLVVATKLTWFHQESKTHG
jgi:hypothetical protein